MISMGTARIVRGLMSQTLSGHINRCASGHTSTRRPPGAPAHRLDSQTYDFGNQFSVPATVRDGRVVRLDGKPYKN